MKESHQPFLQLVLASSSDYSEKQVRSYLEGEKSDELLAKAFELWSYGNNGGAQDLLQGSLTLENCKDKTKKELQGIRGKENPDEIKATPA